jgi:hypothetical protein
MDRISFSRKEGGQEKVMEGEYDQRTLYACRKMSQ